MKIWVGGLILIFVLMFIHIIFWKEENRHKVGIIRGIVYTITGLLLWKNGWNVNPLLIVLIPGLSITFWDLAWYLKERNSKITASQENLG
ncbi:hypothetical protein [Thermococcus sp.]